MAGTGLTPAKVTLLMVKEHIYQDRGSMFDALTQECSSKLRRALVENGSASMLVSGGSTPVPLYRQLAMLDIDWEKINIALVDERWLANTHSASNEKLVKTNLLNNFAAAAKFTAMKTPHESAREGLETCEREYSCLPRPFEFAILGMGADGHTASLFPNAQGLDEALNPDRRDLCASIMARKTEVSGEFTERMTLSYYGLLQARQLVLLISTEEKWAMYKQALDGPPRHQLPVSLILQQNSVPVSVYWAP